MRAQPRERVHSHPHPSEIIQAYTDAVLPRARRVVRRTVCEMPKATVVNHA